MKKFWNWIKDSDETRTLRLEGPIDEESFWGDEITPQMFRDELNAGEGDVTVWINSPGGNVFAAAEIYTMLKDYKGSITVKIDAIAASAASVVAMAGDVVQMSPVAMLNFTVPFVQSIHTVNNKQQDKNIEAQIWGEASDKTPVYAADVIVTYQVLPERSAWLYANVSDTKNLVGDELVASAIKSAMAELGPNEVTNRTKIEPLAQQKLAESLNQKYGEGAVFINKVVINDMDFEEAYNTAIQQKSIAQQNADKQKIENEAAIAKAEADKQVAITKAEAEAQKTSIAADAQAEANRKIAESLSDSLIEYQKIQKWDGRLPTVSGGNALVSIDPAE